MESEIQKLLDEIISVVPPYLPPGLHDEIKRKILTNQTVSQCIFELKLTLNEKYEKEKAKLKDDLKKKKQELHNIKRETPITEQEKKEEADIQAKIKEKEAHIRRLNDFIEKLNKYQGHKPVSKVPNFPTTSKPQDLKPKGNSNAGLASVGKTTNKFEIRLKVNKMKEELEAYKKETKTAKQRGLNVEEMFSKIKEREDEIKELEKLL